MRAIENGRISAPSRLACVLLLKQSSINPTVGAPQAVASGVWQSKGAAVETVLEFSLRRCVLWLRPQHFFCRGALTRGRTCRSLPPRPPQLLGSARNLAACQAQAERESSLSPHQMNRIERRIFC
jgi:hypothetical protein